MSDKSTNPYPASRHSDPEPRSSYPASKLPQLETRLTQLEAHVTEQDAEIYRLSRKVDTLVKVAQDQRAQLVALAELGSGAVDEAPANEKPPHY